MKQYFTVLCYFTLWSSLVLAEPSPNCKKCSDEYRRCKFKIVNTGEEQKTPNSDEKMFARNGAANTTDEVCKKFKEKCYGDNNCSSFAPSTNLKTGNK